MNRAALLGLVLACLAPACSGDDASTPASDAGDAGGARDGGGVVDRDGTPPPPPPPPPIGCGALPAPSGTIVNVTPAMADALPSMVGGAAAGTTFLLEDGTYRMTTSGESARRIQILADSITLRSASDNADAVVIDGEYATNEMITIHASNVTIANLTVMHAVDHPIHVTPQSGTTNITGTVLYGLRILDGGEQFVKINSNSERAAWVDDGRVECSLFRMTDDGRTHVERATGGCYTGGVDAHGARGWMVRSNRFEDIYCAGEGLAEHAIHFWTGSRDTIVENNVIVNCARGIGFGLVETGEARTYPDDPYPGAGYIGHYDGIIRNNVVYGTHAYFDTGVELDQARGVRAYHNTVLAADSAAGFFSSIDYRYANSVVDIRNNLTRRITLRDGASGTVESNLESTPDSYFADVASFDFHLTAGADMAIDRGATLDEGGVDIDGEPHTNGAAPDLGADER